VLDVWRAAPSTLSADRRALTGRVRHFTPIDDIVYGIGSVFDTRVDAPTCEGTTPGWVDATVYLDDKNAPLRWCAGHDPQHRDWLVAKVRVNRGYGLMLSTDAKSQWTWSSFLNRSAADVVKEIVEDYEGTASAYLGRLLDGAQSIPGGTEVDFGFTEDQVRNAAKHGISLVTASTPTLTELLMSLIVKQLSDTADGFTAYVLGILTLTHCGSAIAQAGTDLWRLSGAVADCVESVKDQIAVQLAGILAKHDKNLAPKAAAQKAVGITRRLLLITAAGVLYQLMTFSGDIQLDAPGRALSVFPVVRKRRPITPVVSLNGFGPFAWGASRADAERAVGASFTVQDVGPGCQQAKLAAWPALVFGIQDGRVAVVAFGGYGLSGATPATDTGLRVGDPVSKIFGVYPGASAGPSSSDAYTTQYEYTRGGRVAQFLSFDQKTISSMQFGLAGSVGEAPCV
jgi:hypothetical protein